LNSNKTLVIAVSGSIAAYRTCELVRNLIKREFPVQVMMTANAERFVGRITFQALSGNPVYSSSWDQGMVHIDMKNMAAVFAVVPATANIIGKFAAGIADDLVSSTYPALECPVILAPAMNPGMFNSKAVQRNLDTLRRDGVQIIDPVEGEVVCGDTGQGKMAGIENIEKILIEKYNLVAGSDSVI